MRYSSSYITVFILFVFSLSNYFCGNASRKSRKMLLQDSAVYASQNYSKLHIDSTLISRLVLQDPSLDSFYSLISDFYRRRNYQAAWYTDSSFSTPARSFISRLNNYTQLYEDENILGGKLIFSGDSVELNPALTFNLTNVKPLTDVLLTSAFFKYASREYYGSDKPAHDLEWYLPRKKKNYLHLLDALFQSDAAYAENEPSNQFYLALKKELIRYRQIEKSGGWDIINIDTHTVHADDSGSWVLALKKRLAITSDYLDTDLTDHSNEALILALKKFQQRVGITNHGILDETTIAEFNIPVAKRLQQIMINLERLRWMPDSIPENFLLVNIPDFKLLVMEKGKLEWSMKIIVGKSASGTSIFADKISTIVFRPYWKVPQSIVVKEFLPVLKRDPGYLPRHNMEVLQGDEIVSAYAINWSKYKKSVPFDIRQRPGANNALGNILFLFPNQFDIYMHDTPAKNLFEENDRAFSHGCIRLADAEKLAKYLLRNDSTYDESRFQQLLTAGGNNRVQVKPSMPVFICYFTTWVDGEGNLNFRKDIYGLDEKLSNEIFAHD